MDFMLGRVDLIAILTGVLGLAIVGGAAVIMALVQLAHWVRALCLDHVDRWFLIAPVLALLWILFRGKKLCVF